MTRIGKRAFIYGLLCASLPINVIGRPGALASGIPVVTTTQATDCATGKPDSRNLTVPRIVICDRMHRIITQPNSARPTAAASRATG